MRDRELYATILGLAAPWTVARVEVDLEGDAVHVWLEREAGAAVACPECGTAQTIYDHREREWRHLDTCQLATRLHARVPRVDCPTHGVRQIAVPWATPGSPFTALFERLVIDWLREAAISAVARRLGLSWDAAWGIMRRAVTRGLARRGARAVRYVGVDEKSFQRRHDYVTVVSDLEGARVLYVADDRSGRAWRRSGRSASPTRSGGRSWRSPWTCGSPTSGRPWRRSPTPPRRSSVDSLHERPLVSAR